MRRSRHADLDRFLSDFLSMHAGVRRGMLFGQPVLIAGRRVFARRTSRGLLYRVTGGTARRSRRLSRSWTAVGALNTAAGRAQAAALLERAAVEAASRTASGGS